MAEEKRICMGCGQHFNSSNMLKVGRKMYCRECAEEELNEGIKKEKGVSGGIQIVNNNAQSSNNTKSGKPKGSMGWLIFWILVFWPIAIIYGLSRRWK